MPEPVVELVREASDCWMIRIRAFDRFRDALGHDVLTAFCRCFAHADRLVSLTKFFAATEQLHGCHSPSAARDVLTMAWFSAGTLRELAMAVVSLQSALDNRGILDPDSSPWVKLREFETRWQADPTYLAMRDNAGWRIDPDLVARGLDGLAAAGSDVELCRGDGWATVHSSVTLGVATQISGLGVDEAGCRKFAAVMAGDAIAVSNTLQDAFMVAVEAAAIRLQSPDEVRSAL